MRMARYLVLVLSTAAFAAGLTGETEKEREKRQAELDTECELARQKELVVVRAQLVEECVEKTRRPDRASCERFYKDYGERSANVVPLFYDLPECIKAHEYRTSYRNSGS